MFEAGYKEIVDFGKEIGIYVSEDGTRRISTTIGKIHYNMTGGYHVVPSNPEPDRPTTTYFPAITEPISVSNKRLPEIGIPPSFGIPNL